jgi:thymidylate synthase (FAD)
VLEHGSVTFYLTGISRSLTHELIRHRHFSYSQLSQRYVPERDAAMVEPAVIAEDPELHALFLEASEQALDAYTRLLEGLEKKFADVENVTSRASRPGRPPAPCCPTPPRRASSSPATTARCATSSPCARASTPTSRSASWPSRCCASCSGWRPTPSPTSRSRPLPDGTEVASSPLVGEG